MFYIGDKVWIHPFTLVTEFGFHVLIQIHVNVYQIDNFLLCTHPYFLEPIMVT